MLWAKLGLGLTSGALTGQLYPIKLCAFACAHLRLGSVTFFYNIGYFRANFLQTQDQIGQPLLHHGTGHTPNNRSFTVLRDNATTSLANGLAAPHTVIAHASQHHRQSVVTKRPCHGAKENVGGWPTGILRRPL